MGTQLLTFQTNHTRHSQLVLFLQNIFIMSTFFHAVRVKDELLTTVQGVDLIGKLSGKYVNNDGKDWVCAACKMYLLSNSAKSVADHFAFQHTGELVRMLKDDE